MDAKDNFVRYILDQAKNNPNRRAIVAPVMDGQTCIGEEQIAFGELATQIALYQRLWQEQGFNQNDRVILIIKPSIKLYCIVLSLLSLGMVPVFIDTGMGLKKIKMAIQDADAKAIVGMSSIVKKFWLLPPLWPLKRYVVDGRAVGATSLNSILENLPKTITEPSLMPRNENQRGLISFTSGSTGRPKGADRTHQSLINQHLAIKAHIPNQDSDIDCPCFPMVVLHNLCCGIPSVLPKVDLSQPAGVDPVLVTQQIQLEKVTRMSGAPAYMQKLVEYLTLTQQTLPNVKLVVVGGATVSTKLVVALQQCFPNAEVKVVYGSTESEPIASISGKELLNAHREHSGFLVGYPSTHIELCLANLPVDRRSLAMGESQLLKHAVVPGQEGEIIVSGPHVLKGYVDNPAATAENKISRSNGMVWHRTGDTGFQDDKGRIWLTGRVKDRFMHDGKVVTPYLIEQQLDELIPGGRSAVVGNQEGDHVYVILSGNRTADSEFNDLIHLVQSILKKFRIFQSTFLWIDEMPVDGRHNSKIDRIALNEFIKSNKAVRNELELA